MAEKGNERDRASRKPPTARNVYCENTDALACSAALRKAPDDPATLTLLFTNGSDAGLDRVVLMKRVEAGQYRGTCGPLPAGRWRLAIEDAAGAWALRDEFNGRVDQLEVRAHAPGAGA
jgi:hypothetical protein